MNTLKETLIDTIESSSILINKIEKRECKI